MKIGLTLISSIVFLIGYIFAQPSAFYCSLITNDYSESRKMQLVK